MFAVVRTGGKQYRVAPGDKIVVEKLDGNAGDQVTLGEVLLAGEGSDLKSTDGLTVAAEIVAQAKGEKVTVFKKRRRHNYRRKKGHRQQHTILKIVAIGDQKEAKKPVSKNNAKADPASAPADKSAQSPAAHAEEKTKAETDQQASGDVTGMPTESPAPTDEKTANPPHDHDGNPPLETEEEPAPKKKPAGKKSAGSTADAAPAKAGKKAPEANSSDL